MLAAGYVRVSTNEQVNGYSIPEQTERITAFCKAKGWELGKIYTDGGFSGAKLERPGIQQLLNECQQYGVIVVYKLDRLSRSQKDTLYLIETFKEKGIAFVSMSESFDTSTPFGVASVGIMSVFAQLEREQIKERMLMGLIGRAKSGKYVPKGIIPTGYDYIDGELVIREDEAEQVREIFNLYCAGMSMRKIAEHMHDNYTNRYSSYVSAVAISHILRNPLYIGKMVYAGELYDGTHPAIITPEQYALAQQIHDRQAGKNPGKRMHPLSGLLYCSICGARLVYNSKGKYHYYICGNRARKYTNIDRRRKAVKCSLPYMNADELEKLVLEDVGKIELPEIRKPAKDRSKELQKIDRQITRAMEMYTLEQIDREKLDSMLTKLNQKKAAMIEQAPDMGPVIIAAETAKTMMSKLTTKEIGEVLNLLISRIEVSQDTIDIFYTF